MASSCQNNHHTPLPRHVKANLQEFTQCALTFATQVRQPVSIVSHCPYSHSDLPQKHFPCGDSVALPSRSYSGAPSEQTPRYPLQKLSTTSDGKTQPGKRNFTVMPKHRFICSPSGSSACLDSWSYLENSRIVAKRKAGF